MPLIAGACRRPWAAALAALICASALAADPADKAKPREAGKAAAQKPAAAKPFPPTPVRAARARAAPAVDETRAVGSLRADESVMIRPEIAGRVARIAFAEGQRVQRGELLVALDDAEYRALVASAATQAKLDAQRLARAEDLYKKKFISSQALDEQRANYARSLAKQREDEAKLAKTQVYAPFAGIAGLRQVSEGAFVAAGTDIARLDKIDVIKLDFRVPEVFLGRLAAGQPLRIAVDAYAEADFSGQIYAIEPAVDEQTRTVLVRARVGNPELQLRPGMFARVNLQLGVREQAVWVPEEAIVPRGRESYLFRVVNGKAEEVRVRTGARKVGEVEIVDGVAAGDLVVTEGNHRLRPGAAVAVTGSGAPPKPKAEAPAGKG
ncbi:MAG TPA: efflux RND transporter periplasmic adaptor subunit [Burkholderiales bacterium]|nr:efflux RND transporter periplasmic adaptor subunit [Burkholderiales bacterium]